MKTLVAISFLSAFTWFSTAAELKVATVDLQRLMSEYHRAQEAAKQMKERQAVFLKELEDLRIEGRKLVKETHDLQELSSNQVLSAAEREAQKKSFELKLADLRAFEVRYDDVRAQREAEMQNQLALTNRRILDEVITATRRIGDKDGFNLILNVSRANPAISDVLFAKDLSDITDKVLASLNATQLSPSKAGPDADRQRRP